MGACAGAMRTASTISEGILAMAEDVHSPNGICVFEGSEVHYMKHGLRRISCASRSITRLNAEALSQCRVLILCGKKPSVGARRTKAIREFLDAGGAILAVGGGATCMIENGLFDAEGYYPTGTTIHQSTFDGYHRLTFGYPGAKPEAGWAMGVPMLLRATEGPLMELGPEATSVLTYGRPYSAAAFQRIGKGIALLIGPDPQGGRIYHEVDRFEVTTGEALKTDGLLANAIAFLQDRACNLIPNAGFEENTDLSPPHSNWDVEAQEGAGVAWCGEGAPEGSVFLKMTCPNAKSTATLQPHCPLVVERGEAYTFRCQHRATTGWEITFTPLCGNSREPDGDRTSSFAVPPSEDWTHVEETVAIPEDVSYLKLACKLSGEGDLCLDDLTLQRRAG